MAEAWEDLESVFLLGERAAQQRLSKNVFGNVLEKYHSLQAAGAEVESGVVPARLCDLQRSTLERLLKVSRQHRQATQAVALCEDKLKRKYLAALVLGLRLAREERAAADKRRRDLCGNALKALLVVSQQQRMSRQLHERVLCQIAGRSLVEKFLALRGTEASAEGVRAESAKRTFMQTLRRAESRAEENERRLDNHI